METKETVRMISLGCAKNRVDSEVMMGLLAEKGFIPSFQDEADVVIINTCSFIREAQEEAVETILTMAAAKQTGKCGRLVVAGCLPQRYGRDLMAQLPEVDLFVGTGEFHRIADLLEESARGRLSRKYFVGRPEFLYDHLTPRLSTSSPGSAYIKIAEGCSNRCSYCVIPKIRGKLRSRSLDSVLLESRQAVSQGAKEINLIAQDTTAYGRDLSGAPDLTGLLEGMSRIEGLEWIRLLYAHPRHVSPGLIRLIREERKICKYLDLPLQHIDDRILRAMNRRVGEAQIRRLLDRLRTQIPGLTLRTSLMVGFPGETDRAFRKLTDFIEEVQFDRLGVFRYSREEHTPAAALKGQVPEKVKADRSRQIMHLQKGISLRRNRALVGSRIQVLVEAPGNSPKVLWTGRTAGQAPEVDGLTLLTKGEGRPGGMVEARIIDATSYDLYGEILESP